jgi:ketosteroid isomerase-like protein
VSRENVEIVRRTFGIGVRDVDAWLELYDADVEWLPVPHSLLAARSYTGHEGVRQFWDDLFSVWERYEVKAAEFHDLGDQVVVIATVRARSARGIELDEVWSGLFTLSAGKIVRFQGYADRNGALDAAGQGGRR